MKDIDFLDYQNYKLISINKEILDAPLASKIKWEFRNYFENSFNKNNILDLSNVSYSDSSGLSALLVFSRFCMDGECNVPYLILKNDVVKGLLHKANRDAFDYFNIVYNLGEIL